MRKGPFMSGTPRSSMFRRVTSERRASTQARIQNYVTGEAGSLISVLSAQRSGRVLPFSIPEVRSILFQWRKYHAKRMAEVRFLMNGWTDCVAFCRPPQLPESF